MNLPVLQKMIEHRRSLCQNYLDAETITQLLLDVGTKPPHNDDPYQQFMNVYRQNLFQAADESVRVSRRRRAFSTLQRLNHEMDARVCSSGTSSIPVPTTSCDKPRDEPSLVSLETPNDTSKETSISKNDIPHSVLLPSNKPARRISLPEVVDCCEEGIL